MNKNLICLLILSFIFQACQPESQTDVSRAFYHWKSTINIEESQQVIARLGLEKIYIRVFDIDWDNYSKSPVPLGQIQNLNKFSTQTNLVPCIFITNQTFQKIEEEDLEDFIQKVWGKIKFLFPQIEALKEIQFDCDWTASTKEKYFRFLEKFTDLSGIPLSVTIRLHQIKYPQKTGVPPVDRGMLMFYNMGQLESWEEPNSILNLNEARLYIENNKHYTLPLDLALPIFSWGVVFRDGKMIKLINKIPERELKDSSRFVQMDDTRFRVKKSTYLEGLYLYEKDQIRLEKIDIKSLKEAVKINLPLFKGQSFSLSFYHLDSTFINALNYDEIEAIYNLFQ